MHTIRSSSGPQANSASFNIIIHYFFSVFILEKKRGLEAPAAQIPVAVDEVDGQATVWFGCLTWPQISSGRKLFYLVNQLAYYFFAIIPYTILFISHLAVRTFDLKHEAHFWTHFSPLSVLAPCPWWYVVRLPWFFLLLLSWGDPAVNKAWSDCCDVLGCALLPDVVLLLLVHVACSYSDVPP